MQEEHPVLKERRERMEREAEMEQRKLEVEDKVSHDRDSQPKCNFQRPSAVESTTSSATGADF